MLSLIASGTMCLSISIPTLVVKRTKNKDKAIVIASGTSERKNMFYRPI
jgi:hypothetical protein